MAYAGSPGVGAGASTLRQLDDEEHHLLASVPIGTDIGTAINGRLASRLTGLRQRMGILKYHSEYGPKARMDANVLGSASNADPRGAAASGPASDTRLAQAAMHAACAREAALAAGAPVTYGSSSVAGTKRTRETGSGLTPNVYMTASRSPIEKLLLSHPTETTQPEDLPWREPVTSVDREEIEPADASEATPEDVSNCANVLCDTIPEHLSHMLVTGGVDQDGEEDDDDDSDDDEEEADDDDEAENSDDADDESPEDIHADRKEPEDVPEVSEGDAEPTAALEPGLTGGSVKSKLIARLIGLSKCDPSRLGYDLNTRTHNKALAIYRAMDRYAANPRRPQQQHKKQQDRRSPHDILGLASGASPSEIRKAYLRKALQHHPDKGGDPEEFKKVGNAKDTLLHAWGMGLCSGCSGVGCSHCKGSGLVWYR